MKFSSANLDSLRELYIHQLQTLLSAERQVAAGVPRLAEQASDPQLRQAMQSHVRETPAHVRRLEEILAVCSPATRDAECEVMTALLREASSMVSAVSDSAVRDAALISGAQRIEHYEIAAYGSLRHFARILGETSQAQLLDQTIREEGSAEQVLTEIARRVNVYSRLAA